MCVGACVGSGECWWMRTWVRVCACVCVSASVTACVCRGAWIGECV